MLIGTGRIVSFVMTAWRPRGLEKMSVPINLYSVYGGLFLTHESRTGRGSCPSL